MKTIYNSYEQISQRTFGGGGFGYFWVLRITFSDCGKYHLVDCFFICWGGAAAQCWSSSCTRPKAPTCTTAADARLLCFLLSCLGADTGSFTPRTRWPFSPSLSLWRCSLPKRMSWKVSCWGLHLVMYAKWGETWRGMRPLSQATDSGQWHKRFWGMGSNPWRCSAQVHWMNIRWLCTALIYSRGAYTGEFLGKWGWHLGLSPPGPEIFRMV